MTVTPRTTFLSSLFHISPRVHFSLKHLVIRKCQKTFLPTLWFIAILLFRISFLLVLITAVKFPLSFDMFFVCSWTQRWATRF